jgi:hypothetical protein
MCVVIGCLSLAGSFAYLHNSAVVMVPAVLLLAAVYIGFKWSAMFERFASRGDRRSINIIGEVAAAEARGVIILSAHYDSKSQLMPVVVRASCFILGFAYAILLALFLTVSGVLAATGAHAMGNRAVFYVSLLVPLLMAALAFNLTGNRSPGALDDASGVAVILEVARACAIRPLEHYDVRMAAFGCEEVGLCGSISYLLAHEEELRERELYMLNHDIPFTGTGKVSINTGFELPPVRTSRRLNDLIRRAAEDMGIGVQTIFMPVGAGADHMPWVKHGFEAAGLVCAAANIHSASDTAERVSREGLRRAGEITLSVLRALDQEATSLSKNPASSGAAGPSDGSPASSPGSR